MHTSSSIYIFNTLNCKAIGVFVSLALSLSSLYAQEPRSSETEAPNPSAQNDAQMRPDIEKQRQESEKKAQEGLIQEAVSAIEDTKTAVEALNKGQEKEALEAIKKAAGTIDILVGRHPQDALLPVDFQVRVTDKAPDKLDTIKAICKAAEKAAKYKDYPSARLLFNSLRCEIKIRTYHLPLAAYPTVLKNAAYLLDHKKTKESASVLTNALHTLVIVDQYFPLPIIKAKQLLAAAQEKQGDQKKEKDNILTLLAKTRHELEKAKTLGYAGLNEEYKRLNRSLLDLEKQIKRNQKGTFAFSKVKDKLEAFLKRYAETSKDVDPGLLIMAT